MHVLQIRAGTTSQRLIPIWISVSDVEMECVIRVEFALVRHHLRALFSFNELRRAEIFIVGVRRYAYALCALFARRLCVLIDAVCRMDSWCVFLVPRAVGRALDL